MAQGFTVGKNLQSSNKYAHNYEKLTLGRIDLWVANDLNARYLVRQAGDEPAKVLIPTLSLPDLGSGDGLNMADSVEKVDPLSGLRQNLFIGRRGISQHDGTVIEWAGASVLLVQP